MSSSEYAQRRAAAFTRGMVFEVHDDAPSFDALAELAIENHNLVENDSLSVEQVTDGILVSYVRHVHTDYEAHLWEAERRSGAVKFPEAQTIAYVRIKGGVLDAIARHYPMLAGACERQKKFAEEEGWKHFYIH